MKLSGIFKSATRYTSNHLPQILIGIGITGMVGAVGSAIKATPTAVILIDEVKEELGKDELSVPEVVKTTWKCYIPTIVMMVLSTACIISSNNINEKRKNAVMAALTLSETAYREFKDAAKEVVGDDKVNEISEKVQDKQMKNATVPQVVVIKGDGQLFFDPTTNAKFPSTVNKLRGVVNDLNKEMRDTCIITLNDFYIATGRCPTDIGDDFGWDINNNGYIDIEFLPKVDEDTGTVEYYISFETKPVKL